MPNVDKECVTHHYCDCTAAKLEVGRQCAELLERSKWENVTDWKKQRDALLNTARKVGILK